MYKYLHFVVFLFLIACNTSKQKNTYPIPSKTDVNKIIKTIIN